MDNALKLLTYYDTLDRPLTREEMGGVPQYPAVGEREGYYYLFGREYLVPLRKRREEFAKRKWRIARRVAWWLRLMPFVRLVFASGSLSMSNTDEQSDLDIIIIAKHGRIWTTRFFVIGLLWLLGCLRRHGDRIAPDKICPNHFITDTSLEIPFRSIYTAQLYANLVPLVVTDGRLLRKFYEANAWVKNYVQHDQNSF